MQQISLPKRLIPVLSVKVNIGFEICQHMERVHYSLKDFFFEEARKTLKDSILVENLIFYIRTSWYFDFLFFQ